MTSTEHCLAHALRAIVFINCLILLAGFEGTPANLERWGEAFEVRVGLDRPGGGFTGKWRKYLKGVMPESKLQTALIAEFPMLKQVLDNPLWEVLQQLEVSSDHGRTLVSQLRLDGKPLHGLHRKRLQRRISTAHWQDLVWWLVILASDVDKYIWARNFVRERFIAHLHLICVQPEFAGAIKWLYPLLDHHFREGHLALVAGWPVSVEIFARHSHALRFLPRTVMQLGHIEREKIKFGFLCADPDGVEAMSFGFGFYWDVDWNRRELTPRELRYLSPPLQISLEGIKTDSKCHGKRAADNATKQGLSMGAR